jgi:hypothetical protein
MIRVAVMALVLISVLAWVTGSGTTGSTGAADSVSATAQIPVAGSPGAGTAPSARPSAAGSFIWEVYPAGGRNPLAAIPNPGTGTGDHRLLAALLPQSAAGEPRFLSAALSTLLLPPAVVALPDRDRRSLFIGLRQYSAAVTGPPECAGWTAGLWLEVVTSFNETGVQLAVAESVPAPSGWPLFSEAIITGPPAVLGSLADPAVPAGCRTITSQTLYPGGIRALAATRLGLGSRAFEITGTGQFPVWTWAEVVRGPGFVLEVRIPTQSGSSGSDPGASLASITAAAYQRASTTLGAP